MEVGRQCVAAAIAKLSQNCYQVNDHALITNFNQLSLSA